jgi:hypothetical protein
MALGAARAGEQLQGHASGDQGQDTQRYVHHSWQPATGVPAISPYGPRIKAGVPDGFLGEGLPAGQPGCLTLAPGVQTRDRTLARLRGFDLGAKNRIDATR